MSALADDFRTFVLTSNLPNLAHCSASPVLAAKSDKFRLDCLVGEMAFAFLRLGRPDCPKLYPELNSLFLRSRRQRSRPRHCTRCAAHDWVQKKTEFATCKPRLGCELASSRLISIRLTQRCDCRQSVSRCVEQPRLRVLVFSKSRGEPA
jgi:hypothetical protein